MARIRSLHPTLFTDEAYASLPMAARVLLTGIWTESDDHGIFEWKPLGLKMKIFPADPFTNDDVVDLLATLTAAECIVKFDVDGKPYGAVRNFCRWQRPKKPTYRHPFPNQYRTYVGAVENQSGNPPSDGGGRMEEVDGEESNTEREKPVVVVVPDEKPKTTTTTVLKIASQGKAGNLGTVMGRPLSAEWVPDDALCEKVLAHFGMTIEDVNAELPIFHSYNVSHGTLSLDWGETFFQWSKRWKERSARAAPRVQLSKGPVSEPISSALWKPTDADWDGAAKLYASTGRWSAQFGPDPMSSACRCPNPILEKHGIDPKTGERSIPPKVSA